MQQQQSFSQGFGYGVSIPQAPAMIAFPSVLELLFFRDGYNTQIVKAAGLDALLILTLPLLEKPELTARRGHLSGEKIATARFHDFTTTKVDMTLWGRHERWKQEYDSFTGLGHLNWEPSGEEGFVLDQNGRTLARYSVNSNVQKRLKKMLCGPLTIGRQLALTGSLNGLEQEAEARLEIFAQGLGREQLEEIVVSCAVERERFKKNKDNKRDAKIIGDVFGGIGDASGSGA
ncbi:hypothetical protein GQX73_g8624 [Xylaria multiplex]|uniref:Uncharacterized protein n=1 Tax=Xylaria multiplex TaxID=323545 RepID=A0A7C8MZY7_9PEZI|nr:hypothetical protein GQX73_g8624 [Xylaria multiplex]